MNISQEPQIFTQAYTQGKQVFVLVYMNGCPYCEPIIPIWDKINIDMEQNPKYNSQIKITKIERSNLNKVKDYITQVESFPTFLHMGKGISTTKHDPDRSYESLLKWINNLSSRVRSCPCSGLRSSRSCSCPPSCPCIVSHSVSCSCPRSCRCFRFHKKNTKGKRKRNGRKRTKKNNKKR